MDDQGLILSQLKSTLSVTIEENQGGTAGSASSPQARSLALDPIISGLRRGFLI